MRPIAVAFFVAWFAAAVSACYSGILEPVPVPVLMIAGFVVPTAAHLLGFACSRRLREFILSRSLRFLTLAESSRMVGFVFVLGYRSGILPGPYGVTTGVSDVTIGATALVAAFALISPRNTPRRGLFLWHCLGVLGMLISGTMGVLTSPAVLGASAQPTSQAMSSFPWNLVPFFLGPVTLLLHLTALTIILARPAGPRSGTNHDGVPGR